MDTTRLLKSEDGKSHEYKVAADGRIFIDFVDDLFDMSDWAWVTPEGYEVVEVEHHEKDDTYSWHESPKRLYFKPLPPPVEPDTAPLTHRLDLTRFTR